MTDSPTSQAMHLAMTELKERAERVAELEDVLRAIVAFCDDPSGSEKGESLALGLSRLLPAARSVLNKENGGTKGSRTGELQLVGWLTQAGNIVTGLATYREADAKLYGWEPVYRRIKENDRA